MVSTKVKETEKEKKRKKEASTSNKATARAQRIYVNATKYRNKCKLLPFLRLK